MLPRRAGFSALQAAARRPNASSAIISRVVLASAIRSRQISTAKTSISDEKDLLDAQRLRRPVSPHLEVYRKDHTYFGASAWQRITGGIFSGGLYVFATAYLVAPLTGWHLESASIATFVAGLPLVLKGGLKFLIAWPFSYHAMNGIRQLTLDMAPVTWFQKPGIKSLAFSVWAASIVGALGLVAFL